MGPSLFKSPSTSFLVSVLAFLVLPLPFGTPAYSAGAFSSLHGTWSGGGTVRLENGKSEKIRCRAYYTAKSGGSRVGMAIRCASRGNKFELRANLNHTNGTVSGSWEERTYNAVGNVSGTAKANSLKLIISGALQGNVTISTKGRKQWVSIRTAGPGLKSVTISLRRRG